MAATVAATNCPTNWRVGRAGWRRSRRPRNCWKNGPGPKRPRRRLAARPKGRSPPKVPPAEAVPDPKDQINFTDPESRIMKASNKGWDQCGNAQAVTNEHQIILAADVTDQANDVRQAVPMVDQTRANLDAAGVKEAIGAALVRRGLLQRNEHDGS